MATKRMNVLVYSGNGSTTESVRHCLFTLRRLLSPSYAVIPVTGDVIIKEPWFSTCALLVFPGGADLGYCRTLDGEGNRRISRYVNQGGSYLGFCAGGYYGSARCEFEVDDPKMAVVGNRELAFFPGVCRGLAFEGFVYHSEAGARAAEVKIHKEALPDADDKLPDTFKSYYNGGGVFVDAKRLESRGVEILGSYTEDLHVDSGEGSAAVVYRKVGEGHVVLTGPHPEFAPANLSKIPKLPSYTEAVDEISKTDDTRKSFMRLVLAKLGLKVNSEESSVPPLSRLHLTSHKAAEVSDLVASWSEIFTVVDGQDYIKGENDVFRVVKEGSTHVWGVDTLKRAVSAVGETLHVSGAPTEEQGSAEVEQEEDKKKPKTKEEVVQDRIHYTAHSSNDTLTDYDRIVKTIIPHTLGIPSSQETPSFHHEAFYANLQFYHSKLHNTDASFGKHLLYGSVVTSTSTLLEKNPTLLRTLPTGFTLTATTSVAARGRGNNVWVGPPGSLAFSTLLHHPFTLNTSAPVIFIQYLSALAIVRGIKSYAPGYSSIPVKLKWPNDIYAQLPGSSTNPIVKIGGILVNSSYSGSTYSVISGIGLNLANDLPTTSLNLLAANQSPPLKPFTPEKLLASILAQFESLYTHFCAMGFSHDLETEYYDAWLHTEQIVTLESEGGVRARIKGITRDWGLLLAEELGFQDRGTGRVVALQSDSNSFDFFRGLVRRKV